MIETRASLIERVRDPSDSVAWNEFVTIYQPLLTADVRKRGVGENDAADLVQMVLTRLLTALTRFRLDHERGKFRTWLWQITHSTLTDWHRRRAVRTRAEQGWIDQQGSPVADLPDDDWEKLYRQRILAIVLKRASDIGSSRILGMLQRKGSGRSSRRGDCCKTRHLGECCLYQRVTFAGTHP